MRWFGRPFKILRTWGIPVLILLGVVVAASAKAAVERADAQAVQANRNHARVAELSVAGLASRADYEAAEADLGVAEAARKAANAGVSQVKRRQGSMAQLMQKASS